MKKSAVIERFAKRSKFTLIEMLIVVVIAVMLMGLGASVYHKIAREIRLSIAAGVVKGTLAEARALAMKTHNVVAVYFLDGGRNETGDNIHGSGGSLPKLESAVAFYEQPMKYDAPYSLAIWELPDGGDPKRIKTEMLPRGIGWLDAQQSTADLFPETSQRTVAYYGQQVNARYFCTLIIKFSPSGGAWAETMVIGHSANGKFIPYDAVQATGWNSRNGVPTTPVDLIYLKSDDTGEMHADNPTGVPVDGTCKVRSKKSMEVIRIFPFDRITSEDNGPEWIVIKNGVWINRPFPAGIMKFRSEKGGGIDNWRTVRMNYASGVATVIQGEDETPEDQEDLITDATDDTGGAKRMLNGRGTNVCDY